METLNTVNGQGLDILEEFGIHVIAEKAKPRYSESISIIEKAFLEQKEELGGLLSPEKISYLFDPVEDLIGLVKKWDAKPDCFSSLICCLILGYIKNPAFIELSQLDMAKRILQISEQDPLSVLKEGIVAKEEIFKLMETRR